MKCPNCGVHWRGTDIASPITITIGRCSECKYECVADTVKLIMEKDNKTIHDVKS